MLVKISTRSKSTCSPHLSFGIFWIIFGICFPCVNSQTFSSLGNCTPIDNCSTAAFSSTIVPSAGLPWSFNWVWHNNTAQVIIASVTVLTGDKPMVITPTNLFPYSYSINNVPDRSVVSPNSFKSTLTASNIDKTTFLVIGIPGSQSSPCGYARCRVNETFSALCEENFFCPYTQETFQCGFPGEFSPTFQSCGPPTTPAPAITVQQKAGEIKNTANAPWSTLHYDTKRSGLFLVTFHFLLQSMLVWFN